MFSKGFKIVQPKRFEIYIEDLKFNQGDVIVKVEVAAICKADLRYYIGNRDKRVLDLKYPMNLIHEAVGVVVKDNSGEFNIGDKVVMVPNIIPDNHIQSECSICSDKNLGENYCPKALFASSNYNGFSRNFIAWPKKNIVKINKETDLTLAVFSELISVANSAIRRIQIKEDDIIAIWGDGILGYILFAVLKQRHKGKIIAIGHNPKKLEKMNGANTFLSADKSINKCNIDVAFECIGGLASEKGIDEIINVINPGGKIVLTGVADDNININTRKILEKGISIYGVTRSSKQDFELGVELFDNSDFKNDISKLVLDEVYVNNIVDYYNVFEKESVNRELGKYIMRFNF